MKPITKRFYLFGMFLTFVVVLGLIIQYASLNNIITKDKQSNINKSREHLASRINSNIRHNSQATIAATEFLNTKEWDEEEILGYFNNLIRNYSAIKSIYFGDPKNRLLITGDYKQTEDFDLRVRQWYLKAIEEENLVMSDVYLDIVDGKPVVAISKPVYHNNDFIGVAASDISIEQIIKIVKDTKIEDLGYSFLIDGAGNILAHPKYKYEADAELVNINSINHEIHNEIKRTNTGQTKIEFDGIVGYFSYQPIDNTDWVICNFMSKKEFAGNNQDLWRIFFIVLSILLAIFISFTYIQRKNFLLPVRNLDEDIRMIDIEEDIGYRLPVDSDDPFAELRKSINLALSKSHEFFQQTELFNEEILAQNLELETSYNELAENIEHRKVLESKLIDLSYEDRLTGLYNRRFFEEALKRLDTPENLPLTLIMADVNGLKLINDSFGHQVGDKLLISVAKIIKKGVRGDDIVSRISGDEFVIILPNTDDERAGKLIQRIKRIAQDIGFENEKLVDIELSISFGSATKYNEDVDISEILKKAEDTMYAQKLFEGPSMRSKTIEAIIKALYEKSAREEKHSLRVSMICQDLGILCGFKDEKLKELESVGLLHDIGKIAINENILEKPGKLNSEEWEEVKKHPEIGYRILSTVNEMAQIAEYVLYHHERYDGSGYPKGLVGEEIPLVSRIISIADAYDAMAMDRPYRAALSNEEIVREFVDNAGTQFDPYLARVFVENILGYRWE